MSVPPFVRTMIAALWFCASIVAQTPVVVYEDSTQYSGLFNESANEYGDEIIIAGIERYITQFEFEYVGHFVSQGDEQARIRFYANTGPAWMGNTDYFTPAATPLWETVVPLRSGFNTASISVPYVKVPPRFTWTVKFFGVNMTPTDNAGLLFYGKPVVGSSFNDYWELLTSGWTPERVAGTSNNFSAKILAVSAAPPPVPISIKSSGGNINISWPPGLNTMWLESRPATGGGFWEPVLPLPLLVGGVLQTTVPISAENRIFRLNSVPQPPLKVTRTADGFLLRWSGAIGGQKVQSKAALTDATWTDLPSPTRPNGDFFELMVPAGTNAAFFRLSRVL